ncbi:unnamed protein product [Vitrella brassicaformis CCMP3155]|uniref:sulfate adenylyltransferase n=1 Tax=Vitrella brassicaformis (strain CCMP3155) TaxID=1169540 RepID=A0A0G4G3Y0_VITBC|nr:unnamed protein product [Vitrella brassicaformis CCMP3155]|eukprot:CEM23116.1 unnamed protein product [Vitrella brassicaformis CCMP3155]
MLPTGIPSSRARWFSTSSTSLPPTRTEWGKEYGEGLGGAAQSPPAQLPEGHFLADKVRKFQEDVAEALKGQPGVLITAWLITDNVIADLFHRYVDGPFSLIAVDTLHIFDETRQVAAEMQNRYPIEIKWYKPIDCETREDFQQKYGSFLTMKDDDFDLKSKVEPLQKALMSLDGAVVITGRRNDQGNARTAVPIWEAEKNTFNPLVEWSWEDVVEYARVFDIPVNPLHKRLYLADREVAAKERDTYKGFLEMTLDRPYFYYSKDALHKMLGNTGSKWYVWKSFGDFHTSVPVPINNSERDGRFVKRVATECGIHTRVSNSKKAPHGGQALVDLLPKDGQSVPDVSRVSRTTELTERQVCDLEMLMNGAHTPLTGFMTLDEYTHCLEEMRLPEGAVWGLPVVLDVSDDSIKVGDEVLLHSSAHGGPLAILDVTSVYKPDKQKEAKEVYGTDSDEHPFVSYLYSAMGHTYVGGNVRGIQLPQRAFLPPEKVFTPKRLRAKFDGEKEVVVFQCRNPLHRAHVAMFTEVAGDGEIPVVVHPTIGPSKDDDFEAAIRVPTYEALQPVLSKQKIFIEYFPYHMRLGGPRETIQHMIARKNYGFTQMIVGRDHAGCKDKAGNDFYGPYDAQELAAKYEDEIGIKTIPFKAMVYYPDEDRYVTKEAAKEQGLKTMNISGTEFRRRINAGENVPEWYAYSEVVRLLQASYHYCMAANESFTEEIVQKLNKEAVVLKPSAESRQNGLLDAYSQLSKQHTHTLFFVLEDDASDNTFMLYRPAAGEKHQFTSLDDLKSHLQTQQP